MYVCMMYVCMYLWTVQSEHMTYLTYPPGPRLIARSGKWISLTGLSSEDTGSGLSVRVHYSPVGQASVKYKMENELTNVKLLLTTWRAWK